MEERKIRMVIEGYGYENEEGGITLLATRPTKVISKEFISENSEEKKEKLEDIS